jgi:hypothetical protein
MTSQAAQRYSNACRPRMHGLHRELVAVHAPGQPVQEVYVVWRRMQPSTQPTATDGIGLLGYSGQAAVSVYKSDLGILPPRTMIIRAGETWMVRHQESFDDETWRLHMGEPNQDERGVGRRGR